MMRTRSALAAAGGAILSYLVIVAGSAAVGGAVRAREAAVAVWVGGTVALLLYLVRLAARRGAFRDAVTGSVALLGAVGVAAAMGAIGFVLIVGIWESLAVGR